MKRLILSAITVAMLLPAGAVTLSPDNIDEVIAAMTPEEKVHLVIGCGMAYGDEYKFPGTAGRTYDIPRLGITSAYLADGPHRLVLAPTRKNDPRRYTTTEFPSGTNVAATFDPAAARAVGEALGEEVRDYGLDVLLAPGVNIHRTSLCGRNHEYYSEDPVVAGKMAAEYIKGLQNKGTGACIKHFAVNNQETNRNNGDSRLTQRPLREIYLRPFEIAVKEAQPWTLMTSYNLVNGLYTCENPDLTEDILRGEWGYEGMVMSDWNAGKDAVASMKAGNDMLQPGKTEQYEAILKALNDGTLAQADLDRNVRRILEFVVKTRTYAGYDYPNVTDLAAHTALDRLVGAESIVLLQNNGTLPLQGKQIAVYGCTSYDPVPAGMGFGATGHGEYCVSLPDGLRGAGLVPDAALAERYAAHIPAENQRLYPNGLPPFSFTPIKRADEFVPTAAELAATVAANDAAIITFGRTSGEAADRRREEFFLTANEAALIDAVSEAFHAAGKPVVVVLNICSPVETASWRNKVDAVVCAFQPGQEAGNCIADVLTGAVNPSGRLPMTFEIAYGDAPADANFPADFEFRMPDFGSGSGMNFFNKDKQDKPKEPEANFDYTDYDEGIYVGYRYFDTFNKPVSYPFGHGLSYTTFDQKITDSAIDGDVCRATVRVTNTGNVPGREVVQIYATAPSGKLDKPAKELRGFDKTPTLQPGESVDVTVEWPLMMMASFDEDASAWVLDAGEYTLSAAASSSLVYDSAKVNVEQERRQEVKNLMAPKVEIATLKHK